MAIAVLAIHPNQNFPPSLAAGGLTILSGVVECVFRGTSPDIITRDTLTFTVGRVNHPGITVPPIAAAVVSVASFAYDGPVHNALWAVDAARVPAFLNVDRGTGTADLQVVADLAVRGQNGIILRVNYIVFYTKS